MLRRFVTGTAVATTLALTLTGCFGETKERAGEARDALKLTAAQVLGKAAEKTEQIDTFSMDMTIDATVQGQTMKMTASAQTRLRPEVSMAMQYDSMTVGGQTIPPYEMRVAGDFIYMKMPGLEQAAGGKAWGRISMSDLPQEATGGMNMRESLDQARRQSPAEQTKMFTASKNAREVGKETVEGVPTRHYTGTVALQEALGQLQGDDRAAMEKAYQEMGISEIPFDVWVSDDNLPRKISVKIESAEGPVDTTVVYRDYNKPVETSAPPAAETGDLKLPGLN